MIDVSVVEKHNYSGNKVPQGRGSWIVCIPEYDIVVASYDRNDAIGYAIGMVLDKGFDEFKIKIE